MKILLASMKTPTNFKGWSGRTTSLSVIVLLSLNEGKIRVNLHVLNPRRLQCNFSGPQAGSCERFHDQNRHFSSEPLEMGY